MLKYFNNLNKNLHKFKSEIICMSFYHINVSKIWALKENHDKKILNTSYDTDIFINTWKYKRRNKFKF